jgi:hypothetical protein
MPDLTGKLPHTFCLELQFVVLADQIDAIAVGVVLR